MRAVRLASVFSLALVGALLGAPPGAAAAPGGAAAPTAGCAFSGTHLTLERGTTFGLDFSFLNSGGSDATFTATMLENDFYGARHTFLTRSVGAGLGTSVSAHLTTASAPFGSDDVTIEITSSATGATVLGSCTTRLTISPDTDGDGLLDAWESTGIDVDGDDTPELTLAGANPRRRDIYLEVDRMTDHVLRADARQDVIDAFAGSPGVNPDGSTGITLHVEEDEELAHQDNVTTWAGFDTVKSASFGTAAQRADPQVVAAKRLAYHYVLFAHRRDSGSSSGRAEIGGNDVLVTLGDAGWGRNAANTHNIGSRAEQAGTLMHELGHNLGLDHGGDADVNCKPNYISIMSYAFQMNHIPQVGGATKLDYSRQELDELNEKELLEEKGVGDAGANFTFWSSDGGVGGWSSEQAKGRLDWNEDGLEDTKKLDLDINNLGIDDCGAGPGQKLKGFDDWANLDLNFRDDADFADGAHSPTPPELNAETARQIKTNVEAALAPRAEAGGPYSAAENTAVAFAGAATDPDSDPASLTYVWDFGDGATGTGASPSHVYGDDGTFTVTLTVTDAGGLAGTDTATVTVSNTAPSVSVAGAATGRKGEPVEFRARSTDPGSDDLVFTWTWGDGGTTSSEQLVNPPARDPDPSPQVKPRDVTDVQRHAWRDLCVHGVRVTSADDDGGSAADETSVVVTGDGVRRHLTAYWAARFRVSALACHLRIVERMSRVFSEVTDVSTGDRAFGTLATWSLDLRRRLDTQLLTAWLNFADGAPRLDQLVDTDLDVVPDTVFGTVMARAEAVRLDPGASRKELVAQLGILYWINGWPF